VNPIVLLVSGSVCSVVDRDKTLDTATASPANREKGKRKRDKNEERKKKCGKERKEKNREERNALVCPSLGRAFMM